MRRFVALLVLTSFAFALPALADEKPAPITVDSATVDSAKVDSAKVDSAKVGSKAPAADAAAAAAAEAAAKKRAVLARPAPRSLNEALRRLDTIKVDVDFKDLPVPDAVTFIGQLAGFNVILGPELQRDGLEGLPTVTFRLRKASLRTVADLVARFSGTKLALSEGILSFTTPEAARGKPVLRIYSIGELTFTLQNFPGPDLNLRPSGAEFEDEEITEVENPWSDPDKVADMVKEFVESETWEDEDVSISADKQRLIVRQYPAVQRKIARFLALLRASR